MQSSDISPLPHVTLNPQLFIIPVQFQSKWKAVRMGSSSNLYHAVIQLLTAEKIAICKHSVWIKVFMSAQTDFQYGSLKRSGESQL
jgi:hypothetical protein